MRFERQKLPLTCNQRRRTLPVRITWKGDWSSGVSLRCESASRDQKFFQLFFKTCLLHVSGLWDNFKRKIFFFRISHQSESRYRYRNEIRKAETPPVPITCNQRRRTLPVRITWKGDWTLSLGVSLHCDASRGQKFSKSKNFSTFFQNMFAPRFRTLE